MGDSMAENRRSRFGDPDELTWRDRILNAIADGLGFGPNAYVDDETGEVTPVDNERATGHTRIKRDD